jgi:hypothetical protein
MGQGGSKSRTTADILNEISVNAVQRTISDCVGSATQQQIISADYVAGDVNLSNLNFTQNASVRTDCVLSSQKQNEIKQTIAATIAQYAQSQGQAVLGILGSSRSDAETRIRNRMSTNITQEDIQRSVASSVQQQKVQFGTIGGDFIMRGATFEQSARIVAQGVVNSQQVNSVIGEIANQLHQVHFLIYLPI